MMDTVVRVAPFKFAYWIRYLVGSHRRLEKPYLRPFELEDVKTLKKLSQKM